MKHYKTIIIPERQEVRGAGITCDICRTKDNWAHAEDNQVVSWNGGNWRDGNTYNTNQVAVYYKSGDINGGYGYGKITSFHICPKCFKEKIIPYFKSLGIDPNIEEWDIWV